MELSNLSNARSEEALNFFEEAALMERIALNKRIILSNVIILNKKKRDLQLIGARVEKLRGEGLSAKIASEIQICLNNNIISDDHKETKDLIAREMNPDFISGLFHANSDLTMKEVKHCIFITMNLSVKDVVELTNSSIKSVEMARYRIKRKLELSSKDSLYKYLINLRIQAEATRMNKRKLI